MSNEPPAKKSLGQHWLYDPVSLQAMCDAAAVDSTDVVLEIGPGLGTLTKVLAAQAGQVIAVEFDPQLAEALPARLLANNVTVVHQDILSFDFTSQPANYKIVANIPYYLTSHLLRIISETPNPPATAVLLVQKEVAQRVAAQPGSMSLLSVTAQFYWHVTVDIVVPARLFTPPPKVDSQILILQRRTPPLFPNVDTKAFFRLVKAGFSQRRKTLLNSLSAGLGHTREAIQIACQTAGIDPKRRAQTLALEEWHNLYQALNP